ncbi:hypothetical protein RhiirA5_426171 [Rhizophagus irregularis]|uniref:F-box domain-containing protein n=1 Tax=Rhizophagus irregularis TaxID=588596 RepID=A0A2N0P4T7_9GLOM|nr:hypothetical protein RhiirA5_426171 [Rhizophagus irregularis]
MSQLSADCLFEIFEYLANDKRSLYSCLLVNKLWCNISVRILWRDSTNYSSRTFITLIKCLPNESKKIISKNIIIHPFPISTPMFNYASFCKVLSIYEIQLKFKFLVRSPEYFIRDYIILIEILKLFMTQISSLKKLDIQLHKNLPNTNFTSFPGAENCLKYITELQLFSYINSEFFYNLSQYCHNIKSLIIEFCDNIISDGLKDFLFSIQKNLKYFYIIQSDKSPDLTDLVSSFTTKLYNTVNKFYYSTFNVSFSFINNFTNLQLLEIEHFDTTDVFEKLAFFIFPYLKILRIDIYTINTKLAIKFLENNGKNLEEFTFCEMTGESDNLLNLAIAKFCINLKILSTGFKNNELESLKTVLNACKHLEFIKLWIGEVDLLNEKIALEMITNYSPKNLNRIELLYRHQSYTEKLHPEVLDSFFISWTKRLPYFPISIIIKRLDVTESLDTNEENMNIINKYIKLNVIKKFIILTEMGGFYLENVIR